MLVAPAGQVIDFEPDEDEDEDEQRDNAVTFRRFTALAYCGSTSYTDLRAGNYDLYLMLPESTGPLPLSLGSGSVQTFALVDSGTGTLEVAAIDGASAP